MAARTAPQGTAIPATPFFWRWFRNTLQWPFIRRPGPLACIAEAVARVADDVLADIRWLVNQFNPATCEPEYVDRFGAARGLTRHYRETGEMWRRRVCAAHAWHKLAGRALGMPQILAHYGYTGALMINRAAEGEPELWAHFRAEVVTGDYPVTEDDWELIRWILNATKPAKSVLESLTVVLEPIAKPCIAVGLMAGEVTTIAPWTPPVLQSGGTMRVVLGWQAWETTTILPKR